MEGGIIFPVLTMERWVAEGRSSAFIANLNVILRLGVGLTPKWKSRSDSSY